MVCLSFYFCYFAYGRENLRIFHADRERHFRLPHNHAYVVRVGHQREMLAAILTIEQSQIAEELAASYYPVRTYAMRIMLYCRNLICRDIHSADR